MPYWQYLYLLALLPCLIYTVFYTARAIRLDYTAVPIWDSWRSVQYLDKLLRFDLKHFWLQHNEHRIVFPEVVYALDYIFFRGRQLLPLAGNIACQLAQLALLWWLLRRMKDMPPAFRLTLGAACALFMTSAMQVQGLLGTFELQWYLSELAAALSFLFLWRSAPAGRWASLAISAAAAVVATYSTGNGMMLWPVLLLMAVLLRLPKPRIACLALAGVLSVAVYFVGYSFVSQGRAALMLAHPFYALWFTGVFLGTPVSYFSARLGGLVGFSGLLLVALAVAIAIRRRLGDPVIVVTAGVCLYIAASSLMIAYGRMDPTDPSVGAALAARYVSVPLTYCANLAVVIGWVISGAGLQPAKTRLLLHIAAAAMTLTILLALVRPQENYERVFASQQALAHESGVALVAGIEDPDVIRVIFPSAPFVLKWMPGIRQKRLSIFAEGRQDWVGQPLSRMFVPAPPQLCSGSLDRLTAITDGYLAAGWALDLRTLRPPADIVLVNPAGLIVGLGQTRPGGYPIIGADPGRRPPSDRDWIGFARARWTPGLIQAYAIVHGGDMACPIGSPSQAGAVRTIAVSQVGARIHISAWKADPAWTLNGFHPSVGTLNGEVLYGSFSGNDANRGILTSAPFETAGHTCVAVAVAHGPSVGGQSVRLVEPAGGRLVQSIPMSETTGNWQFWAVELQGIDRLQIVAEDRGNQWGQWVAVGEPHWCRN